MGKLIKRAVIGCLVLILWGACFGLVDYYTHVDRCVFSQFKNRDAVFEVLKENTTGSGLYIYPLISDEVEGGDDYLDLQRRGPVLHLEYSETLDNLLSSSFLGALFLFLIMIIPAALLDVVTNLTFWGKALFVMFVGATGEVSLHLQNLVLPAFSTEYILIAIAYSTIGWLLAGMAMVKWGVKTEG